VLLRQLISSERAAAATPKTTTLGVIAMSPQAGRWWLGFMSVLEPE